MGSPYRNPAVPAAEPDDEARGAELLDAELVVPMVLAAPVFLAVVIRTALRGEAFGAGETLCGAMVAAALAIGISAWRERRAQGLRAGSRER